jgi:hypothetical protein
VDGLILGVYSMIGDAASVVREHNGGFFDKAEIAWRRA